MDVLTDVLDALELKGWICARNELVPPWRYHFAASHDMIFHLISFDGGYLSVEGDPTPLRIEDGAVLLFPFGHAHSMCDKPTSPLTQVLHVDYEPQKHYQGFPDPSGGAKKAALCGAFRLEHPGAFPLQHSLPKVIHIPAEQGRMVQGFTEIVHLIAREAAAPRPGAEVMLRRLTELLFIQVIRTWVEQQAGAETGWVAALRDQSISTALGLKENLFILDRQTDSSGRLRRVVFTGRGWGHGVGMCQIGAYGMALRGLSTLAGGRPGLLLAGVSIAR